MESACSDYLVQLCSGAIRCENKWLAIGNHDKAGAPYQPGAFVERRHYKDASESMTIEHSDVKAAEPDSKYDVSPYRVYSKTGIELIREENGKRAGKGE